MTTRWHRGIPPTHGYYLVTWTCRNGNGIVSELWFNPISTYDGRWFASRGHLSQNGGVEVKNVIAWMPLPAPAKPIRKRRAQS